MFNDTFEIKVRKNNIEGLQESYFGESIKVEIDLEEFRKIIAEQLLGDAKDVFEDATGDDLTFHDEDQQGQLSYKKIIHYLIVGNMSESQFYFKFQEKRKAKPITNSKTTALRVIK